MFSLFHKDHSHPSSQSPVKQDVLAAQGLAAEEVAEDCRPITAMQQHPAAAGNVPPESAPAPGASQQPQPPDRVTAGDDASTLAPLAEYVAELPRCEEVPGDGDGDGDASPSKDAAADDVASPSAGLPQRDEPVEDAGESFDQDTDPQTVLTSRQRERRLQGRRLKERRPPRREDAAALGRGTSFSPEQRLLLLDTWLRSGLPAKDFAALVGVSKHTLYKWKQLFDQQGPAGLMDKPRGATRGSRLPEVTKRTILMLKQQHPEWGCQRISDLLVRGPALPASASAVARVLHEAGYERVEEATRPHQPKRCRFERAKPNELWQTDLFTFMLKRHNRRVYLVAFLDDHSRFLVSYGLHASASTALVLEALEARIAGWGPPAEILTDNGPQYVGGTGGVLRDRRAIHQEQRVAAATVSQRRALGLARRTGLQCTARTGSVPARRSASGKRTGCGR